ncbi:MAG TPA: NYN domain-containing protein [Terriglobales bacterium]|nr:NYN domain-containing protein [Terriglobales bacterium]
MRWVIDGYNVINRAPRLAAQDDGRQALINLLANAAQRSRDTYTVVFDGQRGGSTGVAAAGIRVVYSSGQRTADEEITALVTRDMTVVSDDREVSDAAKRAGARTMSVGDFIRRVEGRSPRR